MQYFLTTVSAEVVSIDLNAVWRDAWRRGWEDLGEVLRRQTFGLDFELHPKVFSDEVTCQCFDCRALRAWTHRFD